MFVLHPSAQNKQLFRSIPNNIKPLILHLFHLEYDLSKRTGLFKRHHHYPTIHKSHLANCNSIHKQTQTSVYLKLN